MKPSNSVIWLAGLIAVLALIAAAAGLFWPAGDSPFSFTTLRGETVQIYGQGLYRYDTPFSAAGFKGSDLLASYTTTVIDVLDLGIITPATFIAAGFILRRDPLGYLIACSLLVLEIMLAPMIGLQTIFQLSAGVTYTLGEIIGPMAGFVILACSPSGC